MITINNNDENKKQNFLSATVVAVAVIFIVGLAAVYYFVITDTLPEQIKNYFVPETVKVQEATNPLVVKKEPPKPAEPPAYITKVIKYSFPGILPAESKMGSCFAGSIAQPFRQDAFRCNAENSVYDPCFSNDKKDKVVCQMNPLKPDIFLINLSQPLPVSENPVNLKDNWAWFVELEDGTICSPYTGTRPLINKEPAHYGCKAKIKGDMDVLIGDLIKGQAWTAKRTIVTKDAAGTGWDTKSSEVVKIKTVWQ